MADPTHVQSSSRRIARKLAPTLTVCFALGAGLLAACASDAASGEKPATEAASEERTEDPDTDTNTDTEATLPAERVLQIDQPIELAGGELEVVLLEILRDSRCPVDVQCIRAGEAEVSIGLRSGPARETLSLGTPSQMTVTEGTALGFRIELLEVAPRPVSTQRLEEEDYRIKIRIHRAPAM